MPTSLGTSECNQYIDLCDDDVNTRHARILLMKIQAWVAVGAAFARVICSLDIQLKMVPAARGFESGDTCRFKELFSWKIYFIDLEQQAIRTAGAAG